MYEFVKKGDAPVVGITKLDGVTLDDLKRLRRKVPLPMPGQALPIIPESVVASTPSSSLSPGGA